MVAAEAELHLIKTNVKLPVPHQVGINFPKHTPESLQHLSGNLTILSISKRKVLHSSGMNPGPSLNSATGSLRQVNLWFQSPTAQLMLKPTFTQAIQ